MIPRLDVGGAQRQLCVLVGGLCAAGHRALVATLVPGGAFRADLLAAGARVIDLGNGERPSPRLVTRLVTLIDREHPDVVHSYLPSANIVAALAKGLRPATPVVWGLRLTEGDNRAYPALHGVTYWLEQHLPWRSDLMIANTPSVRRAAIAHGLPGDRIKVISNGFDADRFRPDVEGRRRLRDEWGVLETERVIGLVGRLDPMKGHDVFLEAARGLAADDPTLRFVCVGPDPYRRRHQFEERTRLLGLEKRLSWFGPEARMWEVYSALDLLCSASLFGEGFPNTIAEAILCGVPCVVTDVGNSRNLVRAVGAVVPPGDARALADACRVLLDRPPLEALAARREGRARIAEEFTVRKLVARTEAVLNALLGKPGRRLRPDG